MLNGDGGMLVADGFDDASIGTVNRDGETVFAYSKKMIVKSLIAQGMNRDEANEYYSFNIECAYVGLKTPVFIDDDEF